MALGQIVAYKRLWRENLIDGETQIPRSERNSQRARISGDRFTSLFEVKNCPTNGGKLRLPTRSLTHRMSETISESFVRIVE